MAARLLVVTLGLVWAILWLSRGENWADLKYTFGRMNLGLFAVALISYMLGQVIVACRWRLLLRVQRISLSIPTALRLQFIGLYYNNFMPSSVGGDLLRAWYVTKHTDRKFEAALSVFVDRVIGLLSTLVIAGFFYAVFLLGSQTSLPRDGEDKNGSIGFFSRHESDILVLACVFVAIFCVMLLIKPCRLRLLAMWSRLRMQCAAILSKTRRAFILYCTSPLTILAAFGLTVVMQVGVITSFWLVGRSMGIQASVKYYYVFFTLTWVFGAIPVSVGGVGVVEGGLVALFDIVGVPEVLAFALAICQRTVWMIASLPGGVIHLVGAHLPKDFSIDYGDAMP